MTEHQLSVVIKADADTEKLAALREMLRDIQRESDTLKGKLSDISSALANNPSLDRFISVVSAMGTITPASVPVTQSAAAPEGKTESTAEVTDVKLKEGLALPKITLPVVELEWSKEKTEHPFLYGVHAKVGYVSFKENPNENTTFNVLNGVTGFIKYLKWDPKYDDEGMTSKSGPLPIKAIVRGVSFDADTKKKINDKLSQYKFDLIPTVKLKGLNEGEKGEKDFADVLAGKIQSALDSSSSSLMLNIPDKALEAAFDPLAKHMDEWWASKSKKVTVKVKPEVTGKDMNAFVKKFMEDMNERLAQGSDGRVARVRSKPVFDYAKIDSVYADINKDLAALDKYIVVPSVLGVQDIAYFVGGKTKSEKEFLESHKLEIPAVIRPYVEDANAYMHIEGVSTAVRVNPNTVNDANNHYADGKLAVVSENEPEFVVPYGDLRKGPLYVRNRMMSLINQKEGGVLSYINDLDRSAIIPMSRKDEFLRRIYGDRYSGMFAYGLADYTVSDVSGESTAMNRLNQVLEMFLASGRNETAYTNATLGVVNSNLASITDSVDRLEDVVSSYGYDMQKMPADVRRAVEELVSRRASTEKLAGLLESNLTRMGTDKTASQIASLNSAVERQGQILSRLVDANPELKGSPDLSSWEKIKGWAKSEEGQNRIMSTVYKVEGRALSAGANIHETLLKKTLGLVQDIYNKMKEASPLLQTVSTLFNLAMRLFFMPLGNKLAEVLIPQTVELVEKVTDMWDMFDEGTSLGDMFTKAIDYGFEVFGEYFMGIGDRLQEQGGIISSVGGMLGSIGKFIESNGKSLIQFLTWMMGSIIDNFREIIATIVAFKVASTTLSVMQLAATLTPDPLGLGFTKALEAAILIPAAMGILAGGIATGALYAAIPGKADGGFVPATPGGRPTLLAEGGEGEFVIPASKMAQVIAGGLDPLMQVVGGSSVRDAYPSTGGLHLNSLTPSGVQAVGGIGSVVNANYYISGYTDSELEGIIQRTVNDMTYDSRLKGRYW